jgi:hypothetical protein
LHLHLFPAESSSPSITTHGDHYKKLNAANEKKSFFSADFWECFCIGWQEKVEMRKTDVEM